MNDGAAALLAILFMLGVLASAVALVVCFVS